MYSNLISAGLLRIQQSYAAQLKQEVAKLYKISASAIQKIQCWPHLLWVVIEGVGARFISYRRLPTWIGKVIDAIGTVVNFEQLKQLGDILRCETQNHDYKPEAVDELREAYRQKQEELKAIKPQLDHQKRAQDWLEHCYGMVQYCDSQESLKFVSRAIDLQSQQFSNLPEVIAKAQEIVMNRYLLIVASVEG